MIIGRSKAFTSRMRGMDGVSRTFDPVSNVVDMVVNHYPKTRLALMLKELFPLDFFHYDCVIIGECSDTMQRHSAHKNVHAVTLP